MHKKRASLGRQPRPTEASPFHLLDPAQAKTPEQKELTTKRRGELAEIAFLHKALHLGFRVSKPFGDSDRYDFITDPSNLLHRVQVKCTSQLMGGLYHLNAHRRTGGKAIPYTLKEIDFFAALVIPEDTWYIIPLSHVLGRTSFLFRPKNDRRPNPYAFYKEAWRLLRQPTHLEFA
jgi:hypothetical protein